MKIQSFYDATLAQYAYAILSNNEVCLIDPARNPSCYYKFAKENNAKITAVILTHPHADYVSGHAEIARTTGANIYMSKLSNTQFERKNFDTGNSFMLGQCKISALNTPGHTPDSICVLLCNPEGEKHAVFTGDTLLVGDVGRPDLLDTTGLQGTSREELAAAMYNSIHKVLAALPDALKVYPGHGAGSLCGKAKSKDAVTTIGRERISNYAFTTKNKDEFIEELLDGQPFVPHYFMHCVETNLQGAPDYPKSIKELPLYADVISGGIWVDVRSSEKYKKGHFTGVLNIPNNGEKPFETWLGAVIRPNEHFYIIAENSAGLYDALERAAKIGYDTHIKAGALANEQHSSKSPELDEKKWFRNPEKFRLWDVRNEDEFEYFSYFEQSKNKPLPNLRDTAPETEDNRPIIVFCGEGYRSTIASSVVAALHPNVPVYDFGNRIEEFADI